jgi:hypothetical protein
MVEGEKNTRRWGLNCVSFFFFLTKFKSSASDRVQNLKQCSELSAADIKELK